MTNSATKGKAHIHGFFVQPWLGYGATNHEKFSSQGEYDRWVQSMADVGAEMLFYQWVTRFSQGQTWFSNVHDGSPDADFAFYNPTPLTLNGIPTRGWSTPSSGWLGSPAHPNGGKEPVAYLLDAAQKAGIKIWLGLYLNEGSGDFSRYNWWKAIDGNDFDQTDKFAIKHHVDRSVAVVKDIAGQFGTHPALGGIYYSVEITNQPAFIKNHAYLAEEIINPVAKAVHAELPGKKLAISPFFNTKLASAEEFGKMWEYVLKNSELDILILQDGVGVEPHTLTQNNDLISEYFQAVQKAAKAAGKPLWGNAELFTSLGDRDDPQRIPSTIDRVRRQLETETPYVDKFVCFDFHYMDPNPRYTFPQKEQPSECDSSKLSGCNLPTALGCDPSTDAAMRRRLYDDYKAYWDEWQRNHPVK